jgi:tyrosinase
MITRRNFTMVAAATIGASASLPLSAQSLRVRRDVMRMAPNDPFFVQYAEAVRRMHGLPESDPRSWRSQALIHLMHCPHGTDDFPHWHRHYIHHFERICAALIGDSQFSLPYWNWTTSNGRIPDPFYDVDALNVEFWRDRSEASSSAWGSVTTIGTRNLIKGVGLQDDPLRGGSFTSQQITSIQRLSQYLVYRSRLEGTPHNAGHVVTGGNRGHMGSGLSPLDPIFWLHHCNVDRLWAEWSAAGNSSPALSARYRNHFVDAGGSSVMDATSSNALSTSAFGYQYDTVGGPAVEAMASALSLSSIPKSGAATPGAGITQPRNLGGNSESKRVRLGIESRFPVKAPGAIDASFGKRGYWAPNSLGFPRIGFETGRIIARFSGIERTTNDAAFLVNVFLNCPYLSPETGFRDPHYAGTFAFFGSGSHHEQDKFVDLTAPLQRLLEDGRLQPSTDLQIQMLPVAIAATDTAELFLVRKVDVFSA